MKKNSFLVKKNPLNLTTDYSNIRTQSSYLLKGFDSKNIHQNGTQYMSQEKLLGTRHLNTITANNFSIKSSPYKITSISTLHNATEYKNGRKSKQKIVSNFFSSEFHKKEVKRD